MTSGDSRSNLEVGNCHAAWNYISLTRSFYSCYHCQIQLTYFLGNNLVPEFIPFFCWVRKSFICTFYSCVLSSISSGILRFSKVFTDFDFIANFIHWQNQMIYHSFDVFDYYIFIHFKLYRTIAGSEMFTSLINI